MRTLYISYYSITEPLFAAQVLPYLEGLSAGGVKCSILSFEKPERYNPDLVAVMCARFKAAGIHWYHLQYHKRPSVPATLFDIFAGSIYALVLVIREKIDVVHARSTIPAIMAWMARFFTRCKFIFDVRGLLADEYADAGRWPRTGMVYRVVQKIERFLFRKADHKIVLTRRIKDELVRQEHLSERDAERVSVIPCCVDLKKFAPRDKLEHLIEHYGLKERFVVLYTGSLGGWYMFEEMLDLFCVIKEQIHTAFFFILSQSDHEMIREHVEAKEISPADYAVHEVPYSAMPEHIALGDMAVIFYKPAFSRLANSPTKLGEYLACGVPVVINEGIGDADTIVAQSQAGVVVERFTRGEYDKAINVIREMLARPDEARWYCRQTAEQYFDLKKGIQLYQEVYEALVRDKSFSKKE